MRTTYAQRATLFIVNSLAAFPESGQVVFFYLIFNARSVRHGGLGVWSGLYGVKYLTLSGPIHDVTEQHAL